MATNRRHKTSVKARARGRKVSSRSKASDFLSGADTGSTPTMSAVPMNEDRALTIPALFRAIDNLSAHIAMLPLPAFERVGDMERKRISDHPAENILNVSSNDYTGAFNFRRALHIMTMLYGTGWAKISRLQDGTASEVELLADSWVETIPNELPLSHKVRIPIPGRAVEVIPDERMIRTIGFSMDGIRGIGLIRHCAAENLGLAVALQIYAASYFGNDTILGTIYTTPIVLKPQEREALRKALGMWHSGPSKMRKPAILDGDLKPIMAKANDETQLIESIVLAVQDVARWTNVPPPFLMELSKATYTNITEQALWYVKYTLAPWLTMYEQEFNRKLFLPSEWGKRYVEFLVEGLLRGSPKERAEFYERMMRMGAMTINEIRVKENLPRTPGPEGDVHWIPTNLAAANKWMESGGSQAQPDQGSPQGDEAESPDKLPGEPDNQNAVGQLPES